MQQSHKHSHTQKPKRNSSTRSHAGHRCRREGKNGAMPKNGAHPDVHIHDNFKSDKTITGSEIRQRAKSCWEIMVNKAHLAKYSNRENTQRDVSRISGRWEPRTRSTGSGGGRRGGRSRESECTTIALRRPQGYSKHRRNTAHRPILL